MKRIKEVKPLRLSSFSFSSALRFWAVVSGLVTAGVGSGVGGGPVFLTGFLAGGAALEMGAFLLLPPALDAGYESTTRCQTTSVIGSSNDEPPCWCP